MDGATALHRFWQWLTRLCLAPLYLPPLMTGCRAYATRVSDFAIWALVTLDSEVCSVLPSEQLDLACFELQCSYEYHQTYVVNAQVFGSCSDSYVM